VTTVEAPPREQPSREPSIEPAQPAGVGARLISAQLSNLEFNRRLLEEAQDTSHPLLERVRFLGFAHEHLDEFFEIHVSGLREQREGVQAGTAGLLPDGRTPTEALAAVEERLQPLLAQQEACWRDLQRDLADHGIHILSMDELDAAQAAAARRYFEHEVFPVLTPLAVDPAHPFPHISSRSVNLAVVLEEPERFARLKVPPNLPRLVPLPPPAAGPTDGGDAGDAGHTPMYFVWLESIIAAHLDALFPGVPVAGSYVFRVTRDADPDIRERAGEDLLSTIQQSLRDRFFGFVVRFECGEQMPESLRTRLVAELEATEACAYATSVPLGLRQIMSLVALDRPDLKYPPFQPRVPAGFSAGDDIFATIRRRDVLLHHPFDSFAPVVSFIEAAAADPDVLAIKQTLYRVGENSPIVDALMRARENNKQVAVLLELKARGDEENNIEWAQALEKVGLHVVYGIIGLKTHCKATLVVRREADGIRRYVHMATGNYNAATARGYTDVSLFTCQPDIGADVTDLFNFLTGYSRQQRFRALAVSPVSWRRKLVELIDREIEWQARGEQGHIIIKVNGLTDPRITELFYRASNAGVKVDLLVRQMCCLRPGVPGMSEHIQVVSIVGRFLEHSRLFYFRNGGREELYMGSPDLMPRNLDRRVETVCPILDEGWRAHLRDQVLKLYLRDTTRARALQPDGTYVRRTPPPGAKPVNAQAALLAAARAG
jgi:polyphosphate kinase